LNRGGGFSQPPPLKKRKRTMRKKRTIKKARKVMPPKKDELNEDANAATEAKAEIKPKPKTPIALAPIGSKYKVGDLIAPEDKDKIDNWIKLNVVGYKEDQPIKIAEPEKPKGSGKFVLTAMTDIGSKYKAGDPIAKDEDEKNIANWRKLGVIKDVEV
jgi:hypothetical protein